MLSHAYGFARDAFSGLLDLVYPPHCLICREEGDSYLCAKCVEKIDTIKPPFCRKCGGPSQSFHCGECRDRQYYFESARSAGIFEGVLRDAIHALKYLNHIAIADPLAEVMAQAFQDSGLAGRADVAIPIPIHPSRKLGRGFNQSEELARRFANRAHLPLETRVLHKTRKTERQMKLPVDLRASNILGSFSVSHPGKIRGKRILLIDDVYTTGNTLDEAARVLLASGASVVNAYTLSKSL